MIERLYKDYLDELVANYGVDLGGETAENILKSYDSPTYEIVRIGNVGFLIVASPPDCHPMCDRFICQAYISPEERKKGLMAEAVRKYVGENKGKYCLDILNGNDFAEVFWKHVFLSLGYERVYLPDVKRNLENIHTLYFAPKS